MIDRMKRHLFDKCNLYCVLVCSSYKDYAHYFVYDVYSVDGLEGFLEILDGGEKECEYSYRTVNNKFNIKNDNMYEFIDIMSCHYRLAENSDRVNEWKNDVDNIKKEISDIRMDFYSFLHKFETVYENVFLDIENNDVYLSCYNQSKLIHKIKVGHTRIPIHIK